MMRQDEPRIPAFDADSIAAVRDDDVSLYEAMDDFSRSGGGSVLPAVVAR